MNEKYGKDIPMGLGMALMQNREAYIRFSSLSKSQQKQVIDGTKNVNSKEEMRKYVEGISTMF